MLQSRNGDILEVDIHGMTSKEAKRDLEQLLSRADKNIKEVRIVHGYHNGQVLRDMVRRQLKHPRIASKLICLNPGETRLILK
jgi:DNA-nicking Smr family endonuclease